MAHDQTPHGHGCQWTPRCEAKATKRVEFWNGGWGWTEHGSYCQPHAVKVMQENVDVDARSIPIEQVPLSAVRPMARPLPASVVAALREQGHIGGGVRP